MARSCCEGASSLCNCIVEPDPNSPLEVTITQPAQNRYAISVESGASTELCTALNALTTDGNRNLRNDDQVVVVDTNGNCQRVGAATAGVNGQLPTGLILPYGGLSSNVPAGFVMCDGSYYAIDSLPNLYAVIGYRFGQSGALFRVPAMGGRVPKGVDGSHALGSYGGDDSRAIQIGNLPNHVHGMSFTVTTGGEDRSHVHTAPNGAPFATVVDQGGLLDIPFAAGDFVNQAFTAEETYNPAGGPQFHTHNVDINGVTNATENANGTPLNVENYYTAMNFIIKT